VKFTVNETARVSPAAAMAAYGTPAFFEGRPKRDNIAVLGVVSHEDTGSRVVIEVRFQFSGAIPPLARAVIDPAKMSWITRTEILPDEHRSTFTVVPDHYPDRLEASGTFDFADGPDPDTCTVSVAGELRLHIPLVGGAGERVIVSGMRSYIANEVATLPDVPHG
jgi:Protein of unknown function (DUF2505)